MLTTTTHNDETLGASGTGKTTFLNTLCEHAVLPPRTVPTPSEAAIDKQVVISPTTIGNNMYYAQ
jgi:septin family protein